MAKVLGIDLGTTNSAMAVIEGGEPEILTNAEGERTTPSVVALSKDEELLVGQTAKRQAVTNSEQTITSIKRRMGEDITASLGEDDYTPQQISAFVLQKLKRDAEQRLGEDVNEAVITVPAYFSDAQRQATKDAGKIAGLDVLRIINEPTAASLAYGYKDETERTLVVFDLGGGTFDVSVLETGDGVFEVKATSGDNKLGGDDFDDKLIDHFLSHLKDEEGVDLSGDKQVLQRLRQAAEEAKIELSSKQKTDVNIPFIAQQDGDPVHLDLSVRRAEFEGMCQDLFERLRTPTRQAMEDAGLTQGEADAVILVGGMTRMPAVQEVAHKLTGVEPDLSVNPDEAVAMGAAIQAGVIKGDVGELLLVDVTPLTLGIETLGGRFTPLIERNTTIPTSKSRVFTTAEDNQTQVDIHVFQGERPIARDNKHLGNFILDGISPAPRGTPQIEVGFDINVDGILEVTAEDKGTGKKQSIRIEDANRLSDDEVDEMREQAEKFAEEDERRAKRIDAANQAETTIMAARNALDEAEEVPEDVTEKVEAAIEDLEESLQADEIEVETVEEKTEALREAMMEVGKAVYGGEQGGAPGAGGFPGGAAGPGAAGGPGAQGAPGPGAGPAGGSYKTKKGDSDDAVDVEYEVKDEDE